MKNEELNNILIKAGWKQTAFKHGWTWDKFSIAQTDTGEFVCSSIDRSVMFPMSKFLAEYDTFEKAVRYFLHDEVDRILEVTLGRKQ